MTYEIQNKLFKAVLWGGVFAYLFSQGHWNTYIGGLTAAWAVDAAFDAFWLYRDLDRESDDDLA